MVETGLQNKLWLCKPVQSLWVAPPCDATTTHYSFDGKSLHADTAFSFFVSKNRFDIWLFSAHSHGNPVNENLCVELGVQTEFFCWFPTKSQSCESAKLDHFSPHTWQYLIVLIHQRICQKRFWLHYWACRASDWWYIALKSFLP